MAVALGTAPAGPSEEGRFCELFDAYGLRQKRAEARDAFAALPDDVDHAVLLAAAAEWRDAWVEDGNGKIGRRTLGQWLKRKDYLCEPTRRRPEKGAKPKKAPVPANLNKAPVAPSWPARTPVTIVGSDLKDMPFDEVESEPWDKVVTLNLEAEDGSRNTAVIVIESRDDGKKQRGRAYLSELLSAVGLSFVDDTEELEGYRFRYTRGARGSAFEPLDEAA